MPRFLTSRYTFFLRHKGTKEPLCCQIDVLKDMQLNSESIKKKPSLRVWGGSYRYILKYSFWSPCLIRIKHEKKTHILPDDNLNTRVKQICWFSKTRSRHQSHSSLFITYFMQKFENIQKYSVLNDFHFNENGS